MNARIPSSPISRPIPLWLKPPNGARSSSRGALSACTKVVPVRSWAATAPGVLRCESQTDERQPRPGVVRLGDRVLLVVERDDRQRRPELLLAHHARVEPGIEDERRPHELAAAERRLVDGLAQFAHLCGAAHLIEQLADVIALAPAVQRPAAAAGFASTGSVRIASRLILLDGVENTCVQ